MRPLENVVRNQLLQPMKTIEDGLNADLMAVVGPIVPGCDHTVRQAIEMSQGRREALAIILDTPGGVVEVVERMVNTIRHHYSKEVTFIVPDVAFSVGTVFVMSGDRIMMDYFSCLGPIDPQIQKEDGSLVPALSYLKQYERLGKKAEEGGLNTAEFALLNKLDLAELHQYEQARDLTVDLLKEWLSTYKFKNWTETETRKQEVTQTMKEGRAEEIAAMLLDTEKWRSHGRGINMQTLRDRLKLKIDDFSEDKKLARAISDYFGLLRDYMYRENLPRLVHTREFF